MKSAIIISFVLLALVAIASSAPSYLNDEIVEVKEIFENEMDEVQHREKRSFFNLPCVKSQCTSCCIRRKFDYGVLVNFGRQCECRKNPLRGIKQPSVSQPNKSS